jgi:hypothetical protein
MGFEPKKSLQIPTHIAAHQQSLTVLGIVNTSGLNVDDV